MSKSVRLFKFIKTKVCPIVVLLYIVLAMIVQYVHPEYGSSVKYIGLTLILWYVLMLLLDGSINKDLKNKGNT